MDGFEEEEQSDIVLALLSSHASHLGVVALCSISPGGESWFGACINSLIHVYMYGYYTLALLKIPVNFMKIYMTSCQMIQFVICLCHACYVAFYSKTCPFELCCDQAFVMTNMLYLFGKFFYKSYIADKKGGKKGKETKKTK